MKGKRTLFLIVFTLVMLVGLVATGTALAAPGQKCLHQPAQVKGDVVLVSEVIGTATTNPDTGERVVIGTVVTYAFHGDLEGTFVEKLNERGFPAGNYTLQGQVTFVGTLWGKKVRWAGCVRGEGFVDPAAGYQAGWEKSHIIITCSAGSLPHLRGTIDAYGSWTPSSGSGGYTGLLRW
jgi:hypothetical protein